MFPNRDSMIQFLNRLASHFSWKRVVDIVDMGVYGTRQQLRVPCASKSPPFNATSVQFDMTTKQNILLPVNSCSGAQEFPAIRPGMRNISLPLKTWADHLVSTPFSWGRSLPLVSAIPFPSHESGMISISRNVVFLYVVCSGVPPLMNPPVPLSGYGASHVHPGLEGNKRPRTVLPQTCVDVCHKVQKTHGM
jgi:hypothetical protein